MTNQKTSAEIRAELEELVATVGLKAAVDAAIQIAGDPKAPAQARTAAINALLRTGALGGFARNYDPADDGKELHELSADELTQRLKKLRRGQDAQSAAATPIRASAFD